jgi:hypothetical protein
MKDECGICNRVLSLYSLRHCARCKKRFCRSCMTMNLWSEQRDLICLNCARRIVAPRHGCSKYGSLREYLWRRGKFTRIATLKFSKLEGIINNNLPFAALRNEKWWNNSEATPQGYAWTSAGWKVQNVDFKERTITFKKTTKELANRVPRRKRRKAKKPFTPVRVKPRRIKRPSKTRIAKVVARAKNIERRRASTQYRVKLKPKSAYEKKLYKLDTKPNAQD